jgi:hypothetical protein
MSVDPIAYRDTLGMSVADWPKINNDRFAVVILVLSSRNAPNSATNLPSLFATSWQHTTYFRRNSTQRQRTPSSDLNFSKGLFSIKANISRTNGPPVE